MYYTKGDTPAAPLVVVPTRAGDVIELDRYAGASATLTNPDGSTIEASARILTDEDPAGPAVAVTLPQLAQAGLVHVAVLLSTDDGRADRFDCPPIAVQDLDGWHTIASAHAEWSGSAGLDDARLYTLLRIARAECLAYRPDAATALEPVQYREAQLVHARNRNAAARIDPATGDTGTDTFGAGPFPLDWTVKQILRPSTRIPVVR